MNKKQVDIVWLIPAEPYRELFREFIRILAEQLDAAQFQPHVTLCRSEDPALIRRVRAEPITLGVKEVAWSAKFTKTLFVRFQPNERLGQLVAAFVGKPGKLRDPHLSLVYKRFPAASKRELAKAIRLPFRTVTFDAVQLTRCVSPTESREDVESWRVVRKRSLVREHRPLACRVRPLAEHD